MPSYAEVMEEMKARGRGKGLALDVDGVRRDKIKAVEKTTGRPLILYASDLSHPQKTSNNQLGGLLSLDDKDGFIEAMRGIQGDNLDVLLHSPGGLAEATESIVALLRSRFKNVRFIIPSVAKSAATMLAMSGDEIVIGVASELGPIDPQIVINGKAAPMQMILEQFDLAKGELRTDPSPAWVPILQMYGPSLLLECRHHIALAEELVSKWLATYMFKGQVDADAHAKDVAHKLNDHTVWRSHSRRIDMAWLAGPEACLKVIDLASDAALDEAVRGLFLALKATFEVTGAFKIVENGDGEALIGNALQPGQVVAQLIPPALQPNGQPASPHPAPQPGQQPSPNSSPIALPASGAQRHQQGKSPRFPMPTKRGR